MVGVWGALGACCLMAGCPRWSTACVTRVTRGGRQYPLGSVLLVALCALACRFDSFRVMGQWVAAAPPATLVRLGLRRRGVFGLVRVPGSATIRRVVNAVMPGGPEELLRVFMDKARVVAVDGKCLRGSRDAAGRAVMVLGAMPQDGTLSAGLW